MKYDQSFIDSLGDGFGEAYVYLEALVACEPKLSPKEEDAEARAVAQIAAILAALSLPPAVKEMGYKRSFFRCERVTAAAVLRICEIAEVDSVVPPMFATTC